jgi:hypothetical protein
MHVIVVGYPAGQRLDYSLRAGSGISTDVVALEGEGECLSYAVGQCAVGCGLRSGVVCGIRPILRTKTRV